MFHEFSIQRFNENVPVVEQREQIQTYYWIKSQKKKKRETSNDMQVGSCFEDLVWRNSGSNGIANRILSLKVIAFRIFKFTFEGSWHHQILLAKFSALCARGPWASWGWRQVARPIGIAEYYRLKFRHTSYGPALVWPNIQTGLDLGPWLVLVSEMKWANILTGLGVGPWLVPVAQHPNWIGLGLWLVPVSEMKWADPNQTNSKERKTYDSTKTVKIK